MYTKLLKNALYLKSKTHMENFLNEEKGMENIPEYIHLLEQKLEVRNYFQKEYLVRKLKFTL